MRVPGISRVVEIGASLEANGALPVNVQDQTTPIVDLYAHRDLGELTLSAATTINATVINVTDASAVVAGNVICIKEGERDYQARVISKLVNATTVGTPLDYAFSTAADVHYAEHDLASVAGSLASPKVYGIAPAPDVQWDVVRVIFHIEDDAVMDDGKFGGIAALTNGVVLRVVNGDTHNVFNVKTNGEFAERAYDREYVAKPPAGTGNAMNVRRTFGGQEKNGVVIRLNGADGDEMQILVQDDLTALSHFHCIVQGHVVRD